MIHRLSDFSDLSRFRLPFIVLKPSRLKYRDLSVRVNDLRWPTVRFVVKYRGREFRVKEFFLDWFFGGFPKSLLRDFVDTYSEVSSDYVRGYKVFTGRNYRGRDSSSAYVCGTQVEIDCQEPSEKQDFMDIMDDILHQRPDPLPLKDYQYPDRSHFSRGYRSDWYENNRISRMEWRRTPRRIYHFRGHNLRSSGMGFQQAGGMLQEIFILEEAEYTRTVWVEAADENIGIEHAFYRVRKEGTFYDVYREYPDERGSLLFRSADGPGVLRIRRDSQIWTLGFSPGFDEEDIGHMMRHMGELEMFLDGLRDGLRQERAYP